MTNIKTSTSLTSFSCVLFIFLPSPFQKMAAPLWSSRIPGWTSWRTPQPVSCFTTSRTLPTPTTAQVGGVWFFPNLKHVYQLRNNYSVDTNIQHVTFQPPVRGLTRTSPWSSVRTGALYYIPVTVTVQKGWRELYVKP